MGNYSLSIMQEKLVPHTSESKDWDSLATKGKKINNIWVSPAENSTLQALCTQCFSGSAGRISRETASWIPRELGSLPGRDAGSLTVSLLSVRSGGGTEV